jgi:methionine synthase II (cobalamin-independent)
LHEDGGQSCRHGNPPGSLASASDYTRERCEAQHPELVAQRIEGFASVVGRERVIAGADCGFATFAGSTEIHPTVAWAKLAAPSEGARLASRRLWRV